MQIQFYNQMSLIFFSFYEVLILRNCFVQMGIDFSPQLLLRSLGQCLNSDLT